MTSDTTKRTRFRFPFLQIRGLQAGNHLDYFTLTLGASMARPSSDSHIKTLKKMFPQWYDQEAGRQFNSSRSDSILKEKPRSRSRSKSTCTTDSQQNARNETLHRPSAPSNSPRPLTRQSTWGYWGQSNESSSKTMTWVTQNEKRRPVTSADTERTNSSSRCNGRKNLTSSVKPSHPRLLKSMSQPNGLSLRSLSANSRISHSNPNDNQISKSSRAIRSSQGRLRSFSNQKESMDNIVVHDSQSEETRPDKDRKRKQGTTGLANHKDGYTFQNRDRRNSFQDSEVFQERPTTFRRSSTQASWASSSDPKSPRERRRSSTTYRRRSSAIERVMADVQDQPQTSNYQRFFFRRRRSSHLRSLDTASSPELEAPSYRAGRGLERFRRLAKAIKVVTAVCYMMKSYVRKQVTTDWSFVEFYLHLQKDIAPALAFDPQQFRKIEPPKGGRKLERLLSVPNDQRTPSDIQKILAFIRTHECFSKFPADVQVRLCQVMQYQSYETRTVIIKQGHVPSAFYLILSGSLIVNVQQVNPVSGTTFMQTVAYVGRGECFGEISLLEGISRSATLVCQSKAELLVVYKEDFDHLILGPLMKQRDDDIEFCLSHSLFEEFPREVFESNPDHYFYQYFPADSVIVSDSFACPFLILVKSGECQVLSSFENEEEEKYKPQGYQKMEDVFPLHDLMRRASPEKVQDLTAQFDAMIASVLMQRRKVGHFLKHDAKENISSEGRRESLQGDGPNLHEQTACENENNVIDPQDILKEILELNPKNEKTHVQVAILRRGSVFGLETLTAKVGSSLSVVSQGVECIMLSKQFYLQHATIKSLRVAGDLVTQYPSSSVLRSKWTEYKQDVVNLVPG